MQLTVSSQMARLGEGNIGSSVAGGKMRLWTCLGRLHGCRLHECRLHVLHHRATVGALVEENASAKPTCLIGVPHLARNTATSRDPSAVLGILRSLSIGPSHLVSQSGPFASTAPCHHACVGQRVLGRPLHVVLNLRSARRAEFT